MLPSLASMRDEKAPPTRKSTVAPVVCQSSDAAFHCLISSGVVQARQTSSIGAAILVSTVIFMGGYSSRFKHGACPPQGRRLRCRSDSQVQFSPSCALACTFVGVC